MHHFHYTGQKLHCESVDLTAVAQLHGTPTYVYSAALIRALYTYRSLSDEELATYVEFSESDAGRWFVATQRKGLIDAMRLAMDAAARQMTTAFPAKR